MESHHRHSAQDTAHAKEEEEDGRVREWTRKKRGRWKSKRVKEEYEDQDGRVRGSGG